MLNLLFPIHFARRVSRHAGTQCLRAIFNCASFRWEWWQIPTKARSCSTSPLGGAGAALSLSSQPTRVLYRRRELARGRRSQHMRCARKFSRRMTILQLKAGRHGILIIPGKPWGQPTKARYNPSRLRQKKRARSRWKEKNKRVMARKCVIHNTYTPFFVLLAGLEPGTSPFSSF